MTAELSYRVLDDRDVGERADVVLGRRLPGLSRRAARRLALEGRLTVDGRHSPPSYRVARGDLLELRARATPPATEPAPLRVLLCTTRFVYVAKPPDQPTHGLRPGDGGTLAHAVVADFPECADASEDPREGGAVHRLDRGTSGVMAFARDRDAWARARAAFRAGTVAKEYEAIGVDRGATSGEVRAAALPGWILEAPMASGWEVTAPLGHGAQRHLVAPRIGGQRAHSRLHVVATSEPPGHLRLRIQLLTGVRHQARVHAALVGHPLLGDPLYGPADLEPGSAPRLHASALDLGGVDPEAAEVRAPLPATFQAALVAAGLPTLPDDLLE